MLPGQVPQAKFRRNVKAAVVFPVVVVAVAVTVVVIAIVVAVKAEDAAHGKAVVLVEQVPQSEVTPEVAPDHEVRVQEAVRSVGDL